VQGPQSAEAEVCVTASKRQCYMQKSWSWSWQLKLSARSIPILPISEVSNISSLCIVEHEWSDVVCVNV